VHDFELNGLDTGLGIYVSGPRFSDVGFRIV